MKNIVLSCSLLLLFLQCNSDKEFSGTSLQVKSGSYDRLNSLVSFEIPGELNATNLVLKSGDGTTIPVEVHGKTGYFLLDSLAAGETKTFNLNKAETESTSHLKLIDDGEKLNFTSLNKPVFSYRYQAQLPEPGIDSVYLRDGYIHPLYSPTEILVTNDYPANHQHHHGIWGARTKTEFQGRTPDFWNMAEKTGTVRFVQLDSTWSGSTQAGFTASHEYVDLSAPDPVVALNEKWKVTVHAIPAYENYYLFDLEVSQQCATDDPLILPEYRYGGVGYRGHHQWEGAENCFFLTSEGKDRSNGHATKARWCHIGGYVNDQFTGVAILDHPENFRSPQPMRIHPNEPFFNYAPSQGGAWQINPGESYTARYRFLVFDGKPDPDYIDQFWNDYANPVAVELVSK